jgi:hypothetical protein
MINQETYIKHLSDATGIGEKTIRDIVKVDEEKNLVTIKDNSLFRRYAISVFGDYPEELYKNPRFSRPRILIENTQSHGKEAEMVSFYCLNCKNIY